MRHTRHILTAFAALSASLTSPVRAQTTTLNFSDLAQPGMGSYSVSTYSAAGYLFTDANDGASVSFGVYRTGSSDYAGRPALFGAASSNDSVITLTRPDGAPFTGVSIALSGLVPHSAFYAPVIFTGTRSDGSTVRQTGSPVTSGLTAFPFVSGFTDLTSLTWSQSYTAPAGHQFTDVALSAAPEPSARVGQALGALGVAANTLCGRRRSAQKGS